MRDLCTLFLIGLVCALLAVWGRADSKCDRLSARAALAESNAKALRNKLDFTTTAFCRELSQRCEAERQLERANYRAELLERVLGKELLPWPRELGED